MLQDCRLTLVLYCLSFTDVWESYKPSQARNNSEIMLFCFGHSIYKAGVAYTAWIFFVRKMYVLCLKLISKLDSSFFVDLINMCFPQNDQLRHSITLMELQMTIWKFHILLYFCAYICQIIFYLVSWVSTKFMQTQKSDKTCQKGQHFRHSASVKLCFWWFSVILYSLISFKIKY